MIGVSLTGERVVNFHKMTFKVDNRKQANIDAPEEKCFRPRVAFWREKSFKSPRFRILFAASILFKINPQFNST